MSVPPSDHPVVPPTDGPAQDVPPTDGPAQDVPPTDGPAQDVPPTGDRPAVADAPARGVLGAAATGGEPPSLTAAVGGPLGIAESAVPAALFVAVYTLGGNETTPAAIAAVVVAAVLAVARLVRRQTLQFALSGLAGVALAAFVVSRTGRAEDFFLPGILINAAYAAAYLVSIVVRWPLMGLILGSLAGQGTAWRQDPQLVRLYTLASWVWFGLFVLRLAVQLPLYAAGALVALGVAKVAMGIPLFALGLWLTFLLVRRATPPAAPAAPAAE